MNVKILFGVVVTAMKIDSKRWQNVWNDVERRAMEANISPSTITFDRILWFVGTNVISLFIPKIIFGATYKCFVVNSEI